MTAVALVLAPLTCSIVLLASGLAKIRDPAATEAAFAAMEVPQPLRSRAVVRTLPPAEIGLAALLLVCWSWPLAVVAGLTTVLFASYCVLVLLVLRRGEPVDCGCFGSIGDDRVTSATLARNAVLLVLAGLATAFGAAGSGLVPVLRDLHAADAAWLGMAVVAVAAAVLVVGVGGHATPDEDGTAEEDLADYERQDIPFALLTDSEGQRTTLRELARERPQLLVFMSTTCGACVTIAERIPSWGARLDPVEIQLVFSDELDTVPDHVTVPGFHAWHDLERGATDTFALSGRPAAVLLGADGLLAGGPEVGVIEISAFVEDIIAELGAAVDETEIAQLAEPADAIPGHAYS